MQSIIIRKHHFISNWQNFKYYVLVIIWSNRNLRKLLIWSLWRTTGQYLIKRTYSKEETPYNVKLLHMYKRSNVQYYSQRHFLKCKKKLKHFICPSTGKLTNCSTVIQQNGYYKTAQMNGIKLCLST